MHPRAARCVCRRSDVEPGAFELRGGAQARLSLGSELAVAREMELAKAREIRGPEKGVRAGVGDAVVTDDQRQLLLPADDN